MKKRGKLLNVAGIFLAVIIVIAGIAVPITLLNEQEKTLVGGIRNAETPNKTIATNVPAQTSSATPSPVPAVGSGLLSSDITTDELYARLRAWDMDGYETVREPFEDELSMDQVVERIKTDMKKFAERNALPSVIWSSYHFSEAQLVSNAVALPAGTDTNEINGVPLPANLGRWVITFEDETEGNKLVVSCDAGTGTIYEINFIGAPNVAVSPSGDELFTFASYYGLDCKDQSAPSTMLTFDQFILSFQSISTNSYTIDIAVQINN